MDRQITDEIEQTHGASNAGRFTKTLVSKALLKPVDAVFTDIRNNHQMMTQPWGDNGDRLLPSKLFKQYSDVQRALKTKLATTVAAMVQQYPHEVLAAKTRLGSMHDPLDYPDPADLAAKYSVNITIVQVPSAADFRVDVADDEAEEIRKQIAATVAGKQQNAVKATYQRIKDVVEKIYQRCDDPMQTFKDSLINNAADLCSVLEGLNLTDDPAITTLHKQISEQLLVPPSQLRTDMALRARTAKHAKKILESLPT